MEANLRFQLEDGTDVSEFMRTIGKNLECVITIQKLQNNGFGHLLPVETQVFQPDKDKLV